ncbi:hypothetical protein BpHYR1_049596 [Brachionus plicatilis]|uniref:Uncharacterized protein n=1 Tax=Brachionus plicatilis TaxID=10195 RepID=A0A3M7QBQ4_BRAPC|nr:hypothetical protein BpHYR1_049596 [Brachionus plicatilis]
MVEKLYGCDKTNECIEFPQQLSQHEYQKNIKIQEKLITMVLQLSRINSHVFVTCLMVILYLESIFGLLHK